MKITSLNLPDDVYEWLRVNVRNRSKFVEGLIRREMTTNESVRVIVDKEREEHDQYLATLTKTIETTTDPEMKERYQQIKRNLLRERQQGKYVKRAKRSSA